MTARFKKYKGIHPGAILERELKKRNISQRSFALSLNEHPQTFNAIIKGKRNLNTALALKIERELNLEEGTMVLLQAYFDIQKIKDEEFQETPNLDILRKVLFWDTDIDTINWSRQAKAVIQRVFERGNDEEKEEIIRFYGKDKVEEALEHLDDREPYIVYSIEKHP